MGQQRFKNNARSTLAGSILVGATSFSVQAGHGVRFPETTNGDFFLVTLQDATHTEVVKVTSRSADSFAVVARAQEMVAGVAGTAYAFSGGAVVSLRLTAAASDELMGHLTDTVDAHDASAISNTPAGNLVATTVQDALNELQGDIDAHLADTADAHDASAISYLGSTNLAATNVEAALDELDAEKQPADALLTALAALVTAADKLIYATGVDTFDQIAFDAAARTLLTSKKFSGAATFDSRYDEKVNARGSINLAQTIDNALGTHVTATITGNTTFTFSNPATTGYLSGFMLELTNGGAYVITWPASVKWPGGVAPTLTAAGVDVLLLTTRDGGTTWRGSLAQKDSK